MTDRKPLPTEIQPEDLGFDPARWRGVEEAAGQFCRSEALEAVAIVAGRSSGTLPLWTAGRLATVAAGGRSGDAPLFLIASLTKPILATAFLTLLEEGRISLTDRIVEYVSEFRSASLPHRTITIRNLLSHTSGLPDMLPNNRELRASHATLDDYVRQTSRTDLVFRPGTGVQYSSMGFAVLGKVIESITGMTCDRFLAERLLSPLGMRNSHLGLSDDSDGQRVPKYRVSKAQQGGDGWNWNSEYWRALGAPWGGMLSTPGDLCRFLQMILRDGRREDGTQLLAPQTVRTATANQIVHQREVPQADRTSRGWGLGWQMNWPNHHRSSFGDLCGPEVFGHWGATGTVFWVDRQRDLFAVLLSTTAFEFSSGPLRRLSTMISAALLEPHP